MVNDHMQMLLSISHFIAEDLVLLTCRQQEPARKVQKRAVSATPSEVTRRVTRHAANQAVDHDHASTRPVDSARCASTHAVDTTRPFTRGLLTSTHASPIATAHTHTQSMADASTSAAGDVLSADRPLTRALKAAGAVTPPAAAAPSKAAAGAATTSARKPPLPPTAAKALTAHKAAQKGNSAGPVAAPNGGSAHTSLPRGESTTPHMATAKKQSSARPTRSAAAAEAADAAAVLAVGVDPDRPLTRRSAAQQVTNPSTAAAAAAASAAAAAAGTSIPRANSRSRNSCNPIPSFAQDEGRLQPLPNVETAARTHGLSAKRKRVNEEVPHAGPAAEGDCHFGFFS